MYKSFYGIFCLMIIFIVVSSGLALKVKLLENNIKKISIQIDKDYQLLQNLKAEWNYLNNPEYLKGMLQKYLPNEVQVINTDKDSVMKIPLKPEN